MFCEISNNTRKLFDQPRAPPERSARNFNLRSGVKVFSCIVQSVYFSDRYLGLVFRERLIQCETFSKFESRTPKSLNINFESFQVIRLFRLWVNSMECSKYNIFSQSKMMKYSHKFFQVQKF